MTKKDKVKILAEYREQMDLLKIANKRIKELKDQIKADIKAGKYGDLVLNFEEREVKEYVVPARVDQIIKVSKI